MVLMVGKDLFKFNFGCRSHEMKAGLYINNS